MESSVSVQRISTSTMKVVAVISLVFACVAARGSGPYLPSGWKPDGPSFYLPSEVSKPLKEPVKEVVFSETEASGSDFLREYGPPKVQEVSQDITQQGLPDVVNEQLFVSTIVETNDAKENSDVKTETTEEKLEVKSQARSIEESLSVTESQIVTATESIVNTEEKALQLQEETTTLANTAETIDAVDEFGYAVEPTEAIIAPTEIVTIDTSVQTNNQIIGDNIVESQKSSSELQVPVPLVTQVEDSDKADSIIITNEAEGKQSIVDITEQAKSSDVESISTITQKANFDIVSTVDEKVQTVIASVEEKVASVQEEVKKVAEVVQNIPDIIGSLEKEVKSQQAETIQEVPVIIKEIFRSIDQAPEGFLEYGPPGFTEYGPPREDLREGAIIEEKIPESQPIDNFVRRRRFSPKLRTFQKLQ